ncbi:MAG: delta-60 repeat domain-containing protein [Acidimicrobiales bacterium]
MPTLTARLRRIATASALIAATLIGGPTSPAGGAPGEVEPGFGGRGFVLTNVGALDYAADVLMQPDGRAVVVGATEEAAVLVRYRADGSLDPGFGAGGIVHGVPAEPAHPAAGALQSDGRIIAVGSDAEFDDMLVVRYLPDGRLDPAFGTGGVVRTDLGQVDEARDVAVQADGRIVVAGRSATRLAIVRYLPNGALDASFGAGGRVLTPGAAGTEGVIAEAVAVLPGGAIVVGGREDTGGQGPAMLLARYTPGGALDPTFGAGGKVPPAARRLTNVTSLVMQGDRVVIGGSVGGNSSPADSNSLAVARYLADGSLDASFGSGGRSATTVGVYGFANDLALDAAGRIVAVGRANPSTDFPGVFTFAVVLRFGADGVPDPGFGCGGRTVVELPMVLGGAFTGVAIDPAGDIVAAGLDFTDDTVDISPTDLLLVKVRSGGPDDAGYWLTRSDGGVTAFGSAGACGSMRGLHLNRPVVGQAPTPSGDGYWLVASDGGIFAFGDARFRGSTGAIRLNRPVVGMAPTPSGDGYWLVASDGGVFAFGGAGFRGSTGAIRLNRPVVGMAPTPSGKGYWLVASDGGVFAFGDARFLGSTGAIRLNKPMVGMAPTPSGNGYWLVASDGGVFAFGDARFLGSTGAIRLNKPMVGVAPTPTGNGYRLAASDGGIFAFGDAAFRGSTGSSGFTAGAVAVSSRR